MKFMIMNYKPYEYELLQDKLNQLGQKGYIANELSLITIFNKVKHPVHYSIDFYAPTGETKDDRKVDEELFIERYRECGLKNIYKKHNMYVFCSQKKRKSPIDWQEQQNVSPYLFRILSLIGFFISIVMTSMIIYYSLQSSFDKFMSYGITFAYAGVIVLLLTFAFRNYLNFYGLSCFASRLQKLSPHFQIKKLSFFRKIYFLFLSFSLILICGGLIEDTFNAKDFYQTDHPFITLQDLGINQKSEVSTQMYSGFVVSHSYISLEQTEQDALYIKEYQFQSSNQAENVFNQLKQTPSKYAAKEIKESSHIIYGYYENDIVSLVIHNQKSVIMIIPSFNFTIQQAQQVIDFYHM